MGAGSWRSFLFIFELLTDHEPRSKGSLVINGLRTRFMGSFLFIFELLTDHEPRSKGSLVINGLRTRFMGSRQFLFELRTAHEPARVGGAAQQPPAAWPSVHLVPSGARWRDWFRRRTTAHFGEHWLWS
jgi:hypothetical protein